MATLISLGKTITSGAGENVYCCKVFGPGLFWKEWKVDDVNDLCVEIFCICGGVRELQSLSVWLCCQIFEKRPWWRGHGRCVEEDWKGIGVIIVFERYAVAQYVLFSSPDVPQRKDVTVSH